MTAVTNGEQQKAEDNDMNKMTSSTTVGKSKKNCILDHGFYRHH